MSKLIIDWSKAPNGTTHVNAGTIHEPLKNIGKDGVPLNSVYWENHNLGSVFYYDKFYDKFIFLETKTVLLMNHTYWIKNPNHLDS